MLAYARAEAAAPGPLILSMIRQFGALQQSGRIPLDADEEVDRLRQNTGSNDFLLHLSLNDRIAVLPVHAQAAFVNDVASRDDGSCGRLELYWLLNGTGEIRLGLHPHRAPEAPEPRPRHVVRVLDGPRRLAVGNPCALCVRQHERQRLLAPVVEHRHRLLRLPGAEGERARGGLVVLARRRRAVGGRVSDRIEARLFRDCPGFGTGS